MLTMIVVSVEISMTTYSKVQISNYPTIAPKTSSPLENSKGSYTAAEDVIWDHAVIGVRF